jgi:DNA mismatch repair protein MutL
LEALLQSIACKSAVKAGSFTSESEQAAFVRQVLDDPEVRHCPHGRPVAVEISRAALEKRFGRQG